MSSRIRTDPLYGRRVLAHAIALFYPPGNSPPPRAWYDDAMDWFKQMGRVPDLIGYEKLPPDSNEREQVSPFTPEEEQKMITRMLTTRSLDLTATDPPGSDRKMFALSLYSCWEGNDSAKTSSCAYIWDSVDAPLDVLFVQRRLQFVLKLGSAPVYGIGYQRPYKLGPEYYLAGVLFNQRDYSDAGWERGEIISRWNLNLINTNQNEHLIGRQRDVYPINILSNVHLDRPIAETTLREWIEAEPTARGTLHDLNDNLWIWHIPDLIRTEVRRALTEAGLLICRRIGETMEDV